MNSDLNNQGSPTNGDQSINVHSLPAKNGSRRKSKSPRELYEMIYEGGVSHGELKNLRIGDSSQVPAKVVAYLKRRVIGAATRVASIKHLVGEYSRIIRNRTSLTEADLGEFRVKKLRAQAELIKAKEDYQMFKQFHEEALDSNSVPIRQRIVAAREDAFVERMAPSKTRSAIVVLDAASTNGKAAEVLQLKQISSGPRDVFCEKFVELIAALDGNLAVEFTRRPKLLTKVVGRVAGHYQAAEQVAH